MSILTTEQRKELTAMSHSLDPLIHIGKNGITDTIVAAIDQELDNHQLVKIRFLQLQDEKQKYSQQIADNLNAQLIRVIGNTALLYREKQEE